MENLFLAYRSHREEAAFPFFARLEAFSIATVGVT
jgi:hypothetical protein